MEKKSQEWKTGSLAILEPEILQYKANSVGIMEMQVEERRRMESNINSRESISWGWSNSSQGNPESRRTSKSEATGSRTRSWLWSNLEVSHFLLLTGYGICPQNIASKSSLLMQIMQKFIFSWASNKIITMQS